MKKLLLIITSLLFNINLVWGQGMPGFGPFADPVTVSGTLEVGEILTGSYEYFDPNMTDESGTTYQWYRYDDEYGSGRTAISGAESQTYTLVAADDGKYIRFEVTPSNGSEFGSPSESQAVGPIGGSSGESGNTVPVASNVTFTGTLQVGETLTGSYDYNDADADPESGSIYIWYRIEGMSKSPIGGADSQTYTLVEADEGKNISFAVIPSDGVGAGSEEESSTQGPVLAAPTPPTISFAGGTGSEASPFQVETLEQLQALKDSPSYHYVLNNDIDASATSTWNSGEGFVPIGGDTPFTGSFDGQGYVITSLTTNRSTEDYVGLFAVIGDGGSVTDIGLEELSVTGGGNTGGLVGENNGTISGSYADGDVEGAAVVGGLVGLNNSNVSESYSAGTVDGTQDIGGLVGLHSQGTVSESYSTSDATAIANNVGGLFGFAYADVNNSYSTGSVSGDTNVGGFVGNYNSGIATNSYSTGSVTGSSNVGGFIGQKYSFAAATNSFWDTQTSGQASATGIGSTTGISGKTTTEMQTESTFTGAGWDFTDIWVMSGYPSLKAFVGNTAPVVTNAVADFSVNEDSSVDPITLTEVFSDAEDNDADLAYTLVSNSNNSLVLTSVDNTQDILGFLLQSDANGTTDITIQAEDSEGLTVQDTFSITVNPVNDAPQFTVAGAQVSNEDTGEQTVENFITVTNKGAADEAAQNLSIAVVPDNEGLFSVPPSIDLETGALSYTAASDSNGTATVTVTLSDNGGTENGGVDQSVKTFVITINPVNDAPFARILYSSPEVENTSGPYSQSLFIGAFSPGPVNELGQEPLEYAISVGAPGLFEVQPEIEIAGTSSSGDYQYAGTLTFTPSSDTVGVTTATIRVIDNGGTENGGVDTYEVAFSITTTQGNRAPVASNAAIAEETAKTGTQITAVYDFEDADGDANAGASFQWYRKVYDEYGYSSEAKIDGATESSYTVMADDNFTDLRVEIVPFDGIAYGDTVTSGYVKASPFEGGSGTEADPFLISTADQLNAMRDVYSEEPISKDGHFKLINDINLDVAPYNEGEGWVPITRGEYTWFVGSLDGDNYSIAGLYINSTAQDEYVGFIGGHLGTVRNLKFEDVNIQGTTNYDYVGPIGYVSGGTVSNVHVTGTVSGPTAGGITGALWNNGTITESSFVGTVTGTTVGGIAGQIEANVGGNYSDYENTAITKSFSAGTVSGESAGGIVGSTGSGKISDSYSLATVSGSTSEGGIANRSGLIQANNYFAGTLSDEETNSYWNASGELTSDVSTSAMKDSLTFANAGWDFENTWAIATGDSVSYPYLQANQQNPKPGIELNNTAPVFAENRLSPKPDTTGVAVDALISAASEEAVSALDLDKVTIKDEDEVDVSGVSASLTENVLTIAHDRFKPFTKYTVTIPGGTVQNAEEVSNSSISWSFTTGIDLTLATILVSPADEATDVDLKPTFKWNTLQGVSGYELMGSLNENFSDSMVVKGITDTTYTLLNELEMGVTFHWRVRGTTDSDSTAWSEPFSFTTTQPNELFTTVDRVTWDDNGTETDVCSDGVNVGVETTVWITITDNTGKVYTDSDSEILEAYIPGTNIGADSDVSFVYDNESGLWRASFPTNVLGEISYVVTIPSISNLTIPEASFEACLTTFVTDATTDIGLSWSASTTLSWMKVSNTTKSKQNTEPFILGLQRFVDDGTGKQVRDTLKVVIDWGDETIEYYEGVGYPSHVYTEAEDYKIRVAGNHNSFKASAAKNQIAGLTSVSNWGEAKWKDLSNAFEGAVNLNVTAEDSPDLTDVKSLKQMFKGARSFNADIGNWDVSQITNLASMFQGARAFNQDISSWDISNVQFFDVASALSAKQVDSSRESITKEKGSGETENSGATEIDHVSGKFANGRAVTGKPAVNTSDTQEKSKLSQNTTTAAQPDSISGFLVGSGLSPANASKMIVGWKDKINTAVQSINIGNIELDALGAAALREVKQATGIQISWGGQAGVDDEPQFSELPNPFEIATEDTRVLKLWDFVSDASTADDELQFRFNIISDSVETFSFDNTNGELAITARADADTFFVAIQVSNTDGITSLDTMEVRTDPSFVTSAELMAALPQEMELNQNYPNPFNPTTVIRYGVPQSSKVRLEVFDMLGRKVATLVNNEQQNAGWHQVNFDASRLASGMYLYRIVAGKHVQTRKMLLIK